jgi:TonB family protein
MPNDERRANDRSLWNHLRFRVAGWSKPTHPRFALHLFLAALAIGLMLGAAWMRTHRIAPDFNAPSATDTSQSGPGAPLPTPMAGGKSALSMVGTTSPSPARTEEIASVAPDAAADAAAQASPDPAAASAGTNALPMQPAVAPDPAQAAAAGQAISAPDSRQPAQLGQRAEVTLSVQVDAQGNPLQVGVQHSSGSPAIDNAALQEVRGRHFAPTLDDGQPVPAILSVTVGIPASGH